MNKIRWGGVRVGGRCGVRVSGWGGESGRGSERSGGGVGRGGAVDRRRSVREGGRRHLRDGRGLQGDGIGQRHDDLEI